MSRIIYILQLKLGQDKESIKSNLWKFAVLLFFMALISVYSSFSLDRKLLTKFENEKYLQQLKSSFVSNKKKVNDLKTDIIKIVKEKPFEFVEPQKSDIIIIQGE